MREIEDFTDDRLKAWCIHCGAAIADVRSNRDHVPTKSFLTKALRERGAIYDRGVGDDLDYLPQVFVCQVCNLSFSPDENYLLCVLHAVTAGSLYPNQAKHPEAATILRSNRHVVRSLKQRPDGQLSLFDDLQPFTLFPDIGKIRRVVVKNARGHAYHEIGEPLLEAPDRVAFVPLERLSAEGREAFETVGTDADLAAWPEVGSRMTVHLLGGEAMVGGWIMVEPGRYRYAVDWSGPVVVKTGHLGISRHRDAMGAIGMALPFVPVEPHPHSRMATAMRRGLPGRHFILCRRYPISHDDGATPKEGEIAPFLARVHSPPTRQALRRRGIRMDLPSILTSTRSRVTNDSD